MTEDLLLLVDPADKVIGKAEKLKCHLGSGLLHRAFSVFVFNDKKELLIQKRSPKKMLWPLFWSNTCCGHPVFDEDYEASAERRLIEEMGIKTKLKFLYKFQYQARFGSVGSENELCAVLIGRSNQMPKPDSDEVADFKYVSLDDLKKEIKERPDDFTPWFKMELNRLLEYHYEDIEGLFNS
ncbi:isopentenyl-diphosphate delta-isomerase [Candidatus Woesearchaeota archaeon]|nr:MAG: isopentenyl-diphosphate delta-isomerase [Candidatus Woesearchaeota archaeon]